MVTSSQDAISLDELESIMNLQRQEAFDDGAEHIASRQTLNDQSRYKKDKTNSSSQDNNNKNRRARAGSAGSDSLSKSETEEMPHNTVGKGKQITTQEKEKEKHERSRSVGRLKARVERQSAAVEQTRSRSSSRGRLRNNRMGESLSAFEASPAQASTRRKDGRGSLAALGQSMRFESDLSKDKLQSPRITSASSVASSDSAPPRRISSIRRRKESGASVNSGTSDPNNVGGAGDSGATGPPPRQQGSYARLPTPTSDAGPRERQPRRNSGKNLKDANESAARKDMAKLDTASEATTGSSSPSSDHRRQESGTSAVVKESKGSAHRRALSENRREQSAAPPVVKDLKGSAHRRASSATAATSETKASLGHRRASSTTVAQEADGPSSQRRPSSARVLAREDRKSSRKLSLSENRLPPSPSGEAPSTDDTTTTTTNDATTTPKNGQGSRKPKLKSFEQLWSDRKGKSSARDQKSIVDEPEDLPTPDLPPSDKSPTTQKKTKIEKIVELQAKYDKYKQEWMQVTKDKRQAEKELKLNKLEITSLTKQVQTHLGDAKALREKLADAKQKMETLTDEHYTEISQFTETSKELVQARIDYTKSLNESRELREDLQNREQDLEEKDKRIASLTMAVESQVDRADALDLKLEHAKQEIQALEDQMKEMEDELLAYRSAAAKDEADGDNVHLKQARDDMEKRLCAERERRLNEKQKKLAEKQREFEAEREKYLEKEKKREEELAQGELMERQKKLDRDEERHQLDGEISSRLKELENDNSALQARLKSEQLVSTDKMKKKDEAIAKLQKEMAHIKNDQRARDADPHSAASLQHEVEHIKAEAEAAKDELDEVQKHNILLSEEIEDLQAAKSELKGDIYALGKEVAEWKRQTVDWQRKAEEWKIKSSDWTAKTFEWKDKADNYERIVKELDPSRLEGGGEFSKPESAPETPQALFLQAAINRKALNTIAPASKMGLFGGIFNKGSTDVGDDSEAEARCKELEDENAEQAEIIKKLRSEIVNIQASFKEAAYHSQKRLQVIQQENDDIALQNTNLQKQLVLARKLGSVAAVDDDDSSPNF